MFGFDHDNESIIDQTSRFNIDAGFDVCACSLLTPYPGTLIWFEMPKRNRIRCFDWNKYDQGNVVYQPKNLTAKQLVQGHLGAHRRFYAASSIFSRFPWMSSRSKLHWLLYNIIGHKALSGSREAGEIPSKPAEVSLHRAQPPIMPERKDWKTLVREADSGKYTIADDLDLNVSCRELAQ